MSGDTHEAVLGKIKALLRLAEDSRARGSLHEAEAAAARAEEMIHRYKLERAAVFAAEPEVSRQDEPIGDETLRVEGRKDWRSSIVFTLARNHGCKAYYWRRWNSLMRRFQQETHVVGRASDVETVRYMAAWLVVEITKLADAFVASRFHTSPRAARNAFCLGAVRGIGDAMMRGRQAAEVGHRQSSGVAASDAAAMVLRDRDADLARWFEKKVGRLRSSRGPTVSDGGAYAAGREAGGRIQTSHRAGLGSGGRKMLGGGGS